MDDLNFQKTQPETAIDETWSVQVYANGFGLDFF